MLAKNASSGASNPAVLVPLYIYPSPGAWNSLYEALSNYTSLDFIVVVNPHSGPGPNSTPDANYTRELLKLNSYPNARTVGYVSTSYATRDVALVLDDVASYRGWDSTFGVKGVFFDETPSEFDAKGAQFLGTITSEVKNSSQGFGPKPLVIFNPGTIPDSRYLLASGPDLTVVFEATYNTYMQYGMERLISGLDVNPSRLAIMVHSIPGTMTAAEVSGLIQHLRSRSGTLFVTDQDTDLYTSFDDLWFDFIEDMAAH